MEMLKLSVYIVAVSVLLLGMLPSVRGMCTYIMNSPDASAKHTVLGSSSFFSYSCTPCVRKDHEVHVLNMYQPYGIWGDTQSNLSNPRKVMVTIKAARPTDIKLMLISHEAAHWVVKTPVNVTIRHIVLVSHYNKQITVNGASSPTLTSDDSYINGWESAEMSDFVINRLGFMSSYTGVYETSAWTLTVGECETATDYLTPPRSDVIKKETAAPKRHAVGAIPIPHEEPKSSNIGQYVIFIVAGAAIVIGLGMVGRVMLYKDMFYKDSSRCRPKCSCPFVTECSCFGRKQNEEPEQIPEPRAIPLLSLPSEPEPPSAPPSAAPSVALPPAPLSEPPSLGPPPWTPSILLLPPPVYEDALNYPQAETPAPPSAPPQTSAETAPPSAPASEPPASPPAAPRTAPPSEPPAAPPTAPSLELLPWTAPILLLPPPTYDDALNCPRPETPPPTYDSEHCPMI